MAPYVGERSVESGRILGRSVIDILGGGDVEGKVIIGNCFPGFPVLENRQQGVQEALAEAPGIEVNSNNDVTVDPVTNYAAWEALLTANPDALALIGLCAPDIASLGQLQAATPDIDFVAGGYDLTADNLAALEAGTADVSIGQTPFMQGYLPVQMLYDVITGAVDVRSLGRRLPRCRHRDRDLGLGDRALRPAQPDLLRAAGARGRPGRPLARTTSRWWRASSPTGPTRSSPSRTRPSRNPGTMYRDGPETIGRPTGSLAVSEQAGDRGVGRRGLRPLQVLRRRPRPDRHGHVGGAGHGARGRGRERRRQVHAHEDPRRRGRSRTQGVVELDGQ